MSTEVHKTIGLVPGTAIYTGEKKDTKVTLEVFDYTKAHIEEREIDTIAEVSGLLEDNSVTWLNINGLNDTKKIEEIGKYCKLHPLIIEDIVHTQQRPKVEDYEDYIFVVFKMLYFDEENKFKAEHLSLVVSHGWVISFQEADGDVFDPIRSRLRNDKGRIRSMGADYLFYALMDAVVDNYFVIIETMGEKITTIEDVLFEQQTDMDYVAEIQGLKKEILKIRRAVFPVRELVSKLEKSEHKIISDKTQFYLRDLYDHTIHVSENIEIYRDMILGLMDMYMTTLSNKMNEVMKVLTIIATIFIPLTFLAGIYGMNFTNIPELQNPNGYFIFWGVIVVVCTILIYFFRRKKWL